MSDELREIDAAAIEELSRIKEEQQVLEQRLARMEDEKANVSEVVYERVRQDYAARAAELEEKARPLKDEARAQYDKLRGLRQEAEQDAEQARLDKEEVDLRHRLGELDDETFEERRGACEKELEERQGRLREIEELRERFVNAFHSAEELETAAPEDEAPPETEPADDLDTQATTLKGEDETVLDDDTAPGDTVLSAPPPEPPVDSQATILLKGPRLVIHRGDSLEELRLGPEPVTIGRAVKNAVRFLSTSVSRHHARVFVDASGYAVRDLGSGNGTLVNSEPVTGDRKLQDGDVIQVGSEVLVYRER